MKNGKEKANPSAPEAQAAGPAQLRIGHASPVVLYLVRHGETDYNRRRIMQGRQINATLNDTGRAQAAALGARLASIPFDALYSSTLLRAEETAEIVAAAHPEDLALQRVADLEEMSWGIFEGEPIVPNVQDMFAEMYRQWEEGAFDYAVEGGESILDVQQRALRAIGEIVERHAGETVLVVTHGRLLRVLLASLLEEYGLHRMQDIQHANTAVNRVTWRDGRFEADLLNSTSHLESVETIMVE
jgi:broad specificity phosphatase PhoE